MAHRSSVASSEDVSRLERVADVQFVAPCRAALTVGGVGVFTTATVPAGTTLLAERPFALTASWERRKHVCDWCMAEDEVSPYPLCCKSCGSVAYCSDACARSATRHSALECEAFAAFAADDDDEGVADLVVQAIRILAHRHANVRTTPIPGTPLEVGYDDYRARLQNIARTKRQEVAIKSAARVTLRVMPPEGRVTPGELIEVLSRHQCNALGVTGVGGSELGLASCLGGMHLFNHSCMPNAVWDSRPLLPSPDDAGAGVAFALRALSDIPGGTEVFICYAASAEGPARRLQYLKDHYGFDCNCARCGCADDPMGEAELADELDAMRCRCEGCGTGLSYPLLHEEGVRRCVHCGGDWEEEEY